MGEDLILHALGRHLAKGICRVYHWCQATGAWVAMGADKQIGGCVQWDGSSSHGWGHRDAFREAGADPCSRTQPWISTPVWESPHRGPKLHTDMFLEELSEVLLLICPMCMLCSGTCSWPALVTGQIGKYSGPERFFLCLYAVCFFLPCMCPKHCKM